MSVLRRIRSGGDAGSALVAAIAVAVIGLALSVVVITQAIVASQDAQRDRVRTIEIHAAEGALDNAMHALESGYPCTFADSVVGTGNDQVTVGIDVTYWEEDGSELTTCVDGQISGSPTKVEITALADSDGNLVGVPPERSITSQVEITPVENSNPGTALYSSGTFSVGGGFSLLTQPDGDAAILWQDGGDWTCSTSTTIDGSLIVTSGAGKLSSASCQINGSVWVRDKFTISNAPAGPHNIGGNLIIYNGGLTLSNAAVIKGNVYAGGTIPTSQYWWTHGTVIGGTTCSADANTPACPDLPLYEARGLPEIDLEVVDKTGFVQKGKNDLYARVRAAWDPSNTWASWQVDSVYNSGCNIPTWMSTTPVSLTSVPTYYDLRDCTFTNSGGRLQLNIYADTMFFANSFSSANGFDLRSGDGLEHRVWFIVPEGGVSNNDVVETSSRKINVYGGTSNYTYKPGAIGFSNGFTTDAKTHILLYTPKTISFANTSSTYGEMYANGITIGQSSGQFYYEGLGVPGIDLTNSEEVTVEGGTVAVIGKHEN